MVTDEREKLIDEICIALAAFGIDIQELKNILYMLMNPYEILSRSTELVETGQDRNSYLLKRFLVAKTVKGLSPKTLKAYQNGIEHILQEIGTNADEITADDIRYYLAVRQRRDNISKVTADNELRYLRSFYQYLIAEELVARNPTARVDRIKCERRRKEAFTEIEIEQLRLAAKDEREKAVIEILLSTGCRVSELVQMTLPDVDGNKILVHGKGAKDRIVYLNAKAQVMLSRYLSERKDHNPYLLPGGTWETSRYVHTETWWKNPEKVTADTHLDPGTVEQMMRKLAKRAGVGQANPHKYRRTCATMALRRGMPIEQVSKMLGHEEIATTQIYLDLSESELEQAHKRFVI